MTIDKPTTQICACAENTWYQLLPFAIPFEKPVFRVLSLEDNATPEELYLSFNLVSLREAISLCVSDKMNTGGFKRNCKRQIRQYTKYGAFRMSRPKPGTYGFLVIASKQTLIW